MKCKAGHIIHNKNVSVLAIVILLHCSNLKISSCRILQHTHDRQNIDLQHCTYITYISYII
jgi:hypothetical protein